MKHLTTQIALLLLCQIGTSQAFAASATSCADKYEVLDNTTVRSVPGENSCYITVGPRNVTNLTYRDFLIDDTGLFMIFNSFGPGPESETTGAREYYFFPRNVASLGYTYDSSTQRLSVTNPSGKIFVFNTEKAILVSISGTVVSQDYNVDIANNGGIEIHQNDGIYLDLGFTLGQSPSQSSTRKVTFKDRSGQTCQVKNSQIFRYTADSDVIFKYSDAALTRFLSKTCPQLK